MATTARSVLLLATLWTCIASMAAAREPETALSSRVGPAAPSVAANYTRHRAQPRLTEVISVNLKGDFSPAEQARIYRAVADWNHVLNGFARFELAPDDAQLSGRANSWVIAGAALRSPGPIRDAMLAYTQPAPSGGGLVNIFLGQLGRIDIAAVILHELGHVLGLAHSVEEGLMAAYYSPHAQRCIDRLTVAMLAKVRGWPLEQLNWCEEAPLWRNEWRREAVDGTGPGTGPGPGQGR